MPINTQNYGNSQAHSETDQRDNGSVTHNQDENVRLAELKRCISGARFPANKNDLIDHASEMQAPSHVVNILQQLQTPEFGSQNDNKLTVYQNVDEVMREAEKTSI